MKKRTRIVKKRKQNQKGLHAEIAGIVILLFALFTCLSLFGVSSGILGDWLRDLFHFLFGVLAFIPALYLVYLGGRLVLTARIAPKNKHRFVLLAVLFLCVLALIQDYFVPYSEGALSLDYLMKYGGIFGGLIVSIMRNIAGDIGTTIILAGVFIIDVLLLTQWSISDHAQVIGEKTEKKISQVHQKITDKRAELKKGPPLTNIVTGQPDEFIFKKNRAEAVRTGKAKLVSSTEILDPDEKNKTAAEAAAGKDQFTPENGDLQEKAGPVPENDRDRDEASLSLPEKESVPAPAIKDTDDETSSGDAPAVLPETGDASGRASSSTPAPAEETGYQFPPLSLLQPGTTNRSAGNDVGDKASVLESTLKSFGVQAKVIHVSVGPTVTRYELEPGPGVRVSKIENLADDIALQLAAAHIRIEAPIPGKSAVGIEVPNAHTSEVRLRDVLASKEFQKGKGHILVALGKDIAGHPMVTDLSKMPHLLIAGSTGSGKSVCINSLIVSILYKYRPQEVKMILVDPKVVELSVYNGIPHLRTEVVTDPRKAAGALNWAVNEMESRYKLFSRDQVRDITGFNKIHPDEKMPYLVIIIDELADLMMVAGDSVEASIARLAQKARAAGIHMVLATQRPSTEVITGLIKANIPSRISFAVSSQIDSRIILDQSGAEELIGKGDMLFKPVGASTPIRIQGAFISDEEVERVTNFIKAETQKQDGKPEYDPIDLSVPDENPASLPQEEQDELLPRAVEWVLDTKRASVSSLQRRFRIGYTRAGRLMDTMEELGIVGPADGAKPREILKNREQIQELISNQKETPNES